MKYVMLVVGGMIVGAIIAAGVAYLKEDSPLEEQACTMEAKICPDGSAVGRSGPNCEFAACPGE